MINNLILCVILIVGAFTNASLSSFIEFNMGKGRLLYWYYKFLVKKFGMKGFLKDNGAALLEDRKLGADNTAFILSELKKHASKEFWFKPLGGCSICMNIWLGFATFFFWNFYFDLPLFLYLPYLLISNAFLRLILK